MMMKTDFPPELFVTGTDTGIGKTVVSAALCSGLGAGYWKPVQAGTEPETDRELVTRLTQLSAGHFYDERWRLKEPMSPHAAAEMEGVEIKLEEFALPAYGQPHLIVEGAGGLLVPLNRRETILDLILLLRLPVLLVARSGLGTLNHTLLSIERLRRSEIPLWGVVLNGPKHPSNEDAIRHFGRVERLFSFPHLEQLDRRQLLHAFGTTFASHAP